MNDFGLAMAAKLAQVAGQALTAWAFTMWFLDYFFTQPGGLVLWSLILLIVIALPARRTSSLKDRAAANFASAMLLWGLISFGLVWSVLGFLLGLSGSPVSAQQMMMLAATVLFTTSGAFYWILGRREEEGR